MAEESVWDIRRELGGRPASRQESVARKKSPARSRGHQQTYTDKPKAPVAADWASYAAQRWVDAASDYGFRLPYNANWLAHQFAARVGEDHRLQELWTAGRAEDAHRWLDKMTDLFWSDWVQTGDTASNVASVFLDEAWDDVRDYAFDSLRAAYLKKHGVPVAPPEYVNHHESPLHQELENLRVTEWLKTAREHPHEGDVERVPLDASRVGLLRSALEKRRQRRSK